jgi:PRC-barrel domain protein
MDLQGSDLRYVAADNIDTPAGRLDGTVVVDALHHPIGKLDGIVLDPIGRRVRAYIVESSGWLFSRLYLVPPDSARLDRDRHELEVDLDEEGVKHLDEMQPQMFPRFSDDDLMAAMFHSRSDMA